MRTIGLHLRIDSDMPAVARRAQALELRSFQCFFIHQKTRKHIDLSPTQVQEFLSFRDSFDNLYVHGAYWINLCAHHCQGSKYVLAKELAMAKQLKFTHYVLHPGCAIGWQDRMQGIDSLARMLNALLKYEHDISIILENTVHGAWSIGSDLHDFMIIREKLDCPEKISFCIDTAHAYSFGYDLSMLEKQHEFIRLIDQLIGLDSVSLIHLNDTKEERGMKRDVHDTIGSGRIGRQALCQFALDKRLAEIPLIMEPPAMDDNKKIELLKEVKSWHQ